MRRDDLRLLVEVQIADADQFLDDLRAGSACADPGTFDLGAEFLVLDELSRIFHGKDHGTGRVPFGRRGLAVADLKAIDSKKVALFQRVCEREQLFGIVLFFRAFPRFCLGSRVILVLSVTCIFVLVGVLERSAHDFEISKHLERLCRGKQRFFFNAHHEFQRLIFCRRIKDAQKTPCDQVKDFALKRCQRPQL